MIKLSALNDESEEDSANEEEVTKEALEQIAVQQYAKALELQRKGNLPDATQLLRDLLDTELLYDVKKPAPGDKTSRPLLNLKYLCYKNLASILSETGDIDSAIESYHAASELDDTDVTLWHRLGNLCMKAKKYEMALHSFQRGAECNPRHWPSLDKIVTLLLGLDYKEECISTIYETLQLDPGYLRGLVYRRHIYTVFRYVRDFMEYINPMYKWDEKDDPIDEIKAEKLLKEADDIHEIFLEQQRNDHFKYVVPELKLKKPISKLNWESVGESLVHMHHYMAENFYSHASYIEIVLDTEEKIEEKEETIQVCEEVKDKEQIEVKPNENNVETEKVVEIVSENENNDLSDKDKGATDTEKVESDIEMVPTEPDAETSEPKTKKPPARRRGNALSFLEQWEWCTKRRSGRKKPVNRQDRLNDNIYDTLRKMVPICLSPEYIQKKENQQRQQSPDTTNLDKLFDEKDDKLDEEYFGSEEEQKDVKDYINKYTEKKKDMIDMLNEYLNILSRKWRMKWSEGCIKTFIEANKCYSEHVDPPSCTDDNRTEIIHYTMTNLLVEEFVVNDKINATADKKEHELNVIDTIGMALTLSPHIFDGNDCLELTLRHLWVKLHIHILNKHENFALDCLYQLTYEFEAMGEFCDSYCLNVINFTFKPNMNINEIFEYIKFLERNKKLSTVMDLYEGGSYEDVLSIIIDSFEHCKVKAKNDEDEMSLDFAVQLALILDTYWALNKVDCCMKWSFICLHEALKHYFRCTSGSQDYEKWTLTVVKVLCCMEHIINTEGLIILESLSQKEISQGLEDLIRIIGHQVETNTTEMPFRTVVPWIIMHYILQREEDQGRGRIIDEKDKNNCEDVPIPLMVLFIAHEQLGNRSWCSKSEGKLLFFILDTVVPLLRSPALSKSLEQIVQYMDQCVYCLFGHPSKKNKLKYLVDHNVTHHTLDWPRAQQLYEIFRPPVLPAIEGKVSGITTDTEQLFHRILALLPSESDPQRYISDVEKYIKGLESKLTVIPSLLPYKMKDIYFLLGDYYFKKEEYKMGVKFNMLDVVVNNDRFESWAEISLAKAVNLETLLNSCKNLNNDREFLKPAKSVIRCFKRALEIDPSQCNMWIEYGIFAYTVHSFCSRLLKQASESLSMEDFEYLEKQKENMLDTTFKCFLTVLSDSTNNDDDKGNEDSWLPYYILGKVAEKRNKPPSVYIDYYMQGVKSLQEADATYPLKINYSSPTHLCIEVLELHYRIHASILKYIEQHENKPIPAQVGKVFLTCIEEWKKGPFTKKPKKDGAPETETEAKLNEPVQAGNILKRSISDAGADESHENKKMKLEAAAAKVRRSASYDTERIAAKDPSEQNTLQENDSSKIDDQAQQNKTTTVIPEEIKIQNPTETKKLSEIPEEASKPPEKKHDNIASNNKEESSSSSSSSSSDSSTSDSSSTSSSDSASDESTKSSNDSKPLSDEEIMKITAACLDALEDCASRFPPHYKAIYRLAHYHFYCKKGIDIERCRDLMLANFTSRSGQKLTGLFSERKHSNFFNNIWKIPSGEVDRAGSFAFHMSRSVLLIMEILKEIDDHKTLLDLSLQLQRIPEPDKKYLRDSDREELAQQAFSLCVQSLKGQLTKFSHQADLKSNKVEREALKSLMLDIYRAYNRAQKQPNSKQLTNLLVEAYKLVMTTPLNENVNLVDSSLKYCYCLIQDLKQQATQASLDKSHNAQKKQVAKAAEAAKASTSSTSQAKPDPKPQSTSTSTPALPKMSTHDMVAAFQSYLPMLNDPVLSQQTAAALSLSYLTNMSALAGYTSMQNSFQSSLQNSFQAEFYRQFLGQSVSAYLPPAKKQKRGPKQSSAGRPVTTTASSRPVTSATSSRPVTSATSSRPVTSLASSRPAQSAASSRPVTSAASSRPVTSAASGRPITSTVPSRTNSTASSRPVTTTSSIKTSKSFSGTIPSTKAPTPVISSLQKSSSASLAPSMGTVLPTLPASMTANLSSFGSSGLATPLSSHSALPTQAHMSATSTVNSAIHTKPPLPHQQVSPGKTLQEKLAERQKKSTSHEINASISRLPASLTITKTSVKQSGQTKKADAKKSLSFSESEARPKPKPFTTEEIIILDDD